MASLTERRFEQIESLLQDLLQKLRMGVAVDVETPLRASLKMSYREFHDCMEDLLKRKDDFAPVAALALEKGSGHNSPRSQHTTILAKLYGTRNYFSADLPNLRQRWFAQFGISANEIGLGEALPAPDQSANGEDRAE